MTVFQKKSPDTPTGVVAEMLGLKQKANVVSFYEFIESPRYMNLKGFVYPYWHKQFKTAHSSVTELILSGSIGGGKCLSVAKPISSHLGNITGNQLRKAFHIPEGTYGYFPVDHLKVEQTDGSFEPVSHLYYEKDAKCRKVVLSHGKDIEATLEHPVLALKATSPQPCLIKVGDLSVGDYVLLRKSDFKTLPIQCKLENRSEPINYMLVRRLLSKFSKSADYSVRVAVRKIETNYNPTHIGTILKKMRSVGIQFNETKLLSEQVLSTDEILPTLFEDYYYSKIVSIEDTVTDVYDVTVPTTHMFMSNGVPMHNTTLALLYLLYRIYRLFSQGDPAEQLGLMRGSNVYVLYFGISLQSAEKSGFRQLKNLLDGSPWFSRNFPRDKSVESSIRFGNHFYIDFASGEGHQIGLNVWGFILDEANFREGVGTGNADQYEGVYSLCQQLLDRQLNRFSKGGVLNAISIFVSSAAYQTSFMERRKELAEGDPTTKVIDSVSYEVSPEKYSKKRFEVFIGYGQVEPCVVENATHRSNLIKQCEFVESNADHLFRKVPVELKKSFLADVYRALQNHCGVSTSVKGTFLRNPSILTNSYDKELVSPLTQPTVVASNQDALEIFPIFSIGDLTDPYAPHSLHLDLSVTGDSGGLSCVRYDGTVNGLRQHTHIFTLEIVPPAVPAMTMISKVQDFIIWLTQHMNIVAFSSDNYQSVQLRQTVCAQTGLKNIRLSIDSSDEFHLLWAQALAEHRFKMQYIPKLDLEIKEAEHDLKRRKVIKRPGSTDDLFQSLVGAFFLSDTEVAPLADHSESLYSTNSNVVNSAQVNRMLKKLGYQRM